jgi:hypothetical protein
MNSDPHDSTAWRSFGMLDTDETAGFDEAMRHDPQLKAAARDMDRLSAAVALATSHPVIPRDGHLERIQSRLGMHHPRRAPLWFGISGWAAAAALALLLVWNVKGFRGLPAQPGPIVNSPGVTESAVHDGVPADVQAVATNDNPSDTDTAPAKQPSPETNPSGLVIRRETEQLTREIAVLQSQVQLYQSRERAWSQVLPGVALPVIMKMTPPGAESTIDSSLAMNDSPISQLLGETLRIAGSAKQGSGDSPDAVMSTADTAFLNTAVEVPAVAPAGAIPIYDAARDAGTLVVTNLPPAPTGLEYNLWVQAKRDGPPVRIGILPDAGTSPSESFDFSLGDNQVMPSGFILTQDPADRPAAPNADNTVLQSPQAKEP